MCKKGVHIVLDFGRQKRALQARLDYYRAVFPHRSLEYRAFKNKISIPRIHQALKLIEQGGYGICQKCNEKIESQRLVLVPAALYCLACQVGMEERSKRARHH